MVYPIQYWVDPYVYGAYRFMAPKAVMFFLPPALFHGFCLFMPVPRSIVKRWPWTPHAILGWIFSPRLVEVAKICCILEIWPFQVLHINFQYLLPLGWRDPPDMGTKRLLQHLFLWIFSGFGRGLGWTWVDYSHGSAIARRRQVPMPAMQNTPWPRAWTRHGMAMGCHGMFWRWLNMAEKWGKSPLFVDNFRISMDILESFPIIPNQYGKTWEVMWNPICIINLWNRGEDAGGLPFPLDQWTVGLRGGYIVIIIGISCYLCLGLLTLTQTLTQTQTHIDPHFHIANVPYNAAETCLD